MIALAAKSRKNRMFFDNLIKEIAISINVGDVTLNQNLELPSYRGMQRRKEENVVHIGSNHQAVGFDTPRSMLTHTTLCALDALLGEAKDKGLKGCGSRQRIADFIISQTDLTECHLTALNEMMSLR